MSQHHAAAVSNHTVMPMFPSMLFAGHCIALCLMTVLFIQYCLLLVSHCVFVCCSVPY